MDKTLLPGLTLQELEDYVKALGEPGYRARQLGDWLKKGTDFEDMRNLPLSLIGKLREASIARPAGILSRQRSQIDGTEKYLFELVDGHTVEGVLMRYRHGLTLCLSTQVGCRMGCAFCASTLGGRLRNLMAGEMVGMAALINRLCQPERVHNIVLMGSGEPLDNYDEVLRFLRLITSPDSLNIGVRHISLSTCGLPEEMRRLAREGLPVTLSVSLHAPNDTIRRSIMPIAHKVSMDELLSACRDYAQVTGRRVVFEYALIQGVNANNSHARELARRLAGMLCHVNLIPLNDVPERDLRAATPREVAEFRLTLENAGISATVRREMGADISGACGQLRAQYLKNPLIPTQEETG
ncbi:MAG: 23S rRNA (adenine(2503)-C(2))-methyltransferase RlmN [Eubacteriales bacterium]|nr:23S rRNA (adenine(2503)-C(2))-methyltransferase RlmN [Eubacteriales bacterium]